MNRKFKLAILMDRRMFRRTVSPEDLARLKRMVRIGSLDLPTYMTEKKATELIQNADICLTGWGTCTLSEVILKSAPGLKFIMHTGGTVKNLINDKVWERNLIVSSAAPAIAVGVAETALGLMISGLKRFYWFREDIKKGGWRNVEEIGRVKELYGLTIGVVGASNVGRNFIRLLHNFTVKIIIYDPCLSVTEAKRLEAEKVGLSALMKRADVVSIHAPAIPRTRHMIDAGCLKMMKKRALLINTARGSIIDEQALIKELKKGRITACLDVTDPEPPLKNSPLRRLPNVILTPHIAGSVTNNMLRQGKFAIDEIERLLKGKKLKNRITRDELKRLA
jgi:phosphoglycerate dehydrogenase-like enzyme